MAIEMEVMRPGQIVRAVDATLKNLLNTFANQGFNGRKLFICEVIKDFKICQEHTLLEVHKDLMNMSERKDEEIGRHHIL